jgi:hypothetical protein
VVKQCGPERSKKTGTTPLAIVFQDAVFNNLNYCTMNKKKKENQKNPVLSTERTGEQLWQDLMNAPYNEESIGQSFIIIGAGQLSKKLARQEKIKNRNNG